MSCESAPNDGVGPKKRLPTRYEQFRYLLTPLGFDGFTLRVCRVRLRPRRRAVDAWRRADSAHPEAHFAAQGPGRPARKARREAGDSRQGLVGHLRVRGEHHGPGVQAAAVAWRNPRAADPRDDSRRGDIDGCCRSACWPSIWTRRGKSTWTVIRRTTRSPFPHFQSLIFRRNLLSLHHLRPLTPSWGLSPIRLMG